MQELDSKLVSYLNGKKIFCIPSESRRWMAYFIVRSWGNYLFFPHPDIGNMYPFIKAQGGIFKVFDEDLPFPYFNEQIFSIFGASTVRSKENSNSNFLIEKNGEDFFDPNITIQEGYFNIYHKQENFIFIDYNFRENKNFPNGLNLSRLAFFD